MKERHTLIVENFLENQELRRGYRIALNNLTELCHSISRDRGWTINLETGREEPRDPFVMIGLMHTELSEAFEAVRKGDGEDKHIKNCSALEVELVDCLIRILDFLGEREADVGLILLKKQLFNIERSDHSLEQRMKDGGKKV